MRARHGRVTCATPPPAQGRGLPLAALLGAAGILAPLLALPPASAASAQTTAFAATDHDAVRDAAAAAGFDLEAALGYLAGLPEGTRRAFAPYLVEAAVASGLDPAAWPPGSPALPMLAGTDESTPFQQLLRPLHARRLAGPGALADDPGVVQRVRDGFSGGQYGDAALDNDDAWALLALQGDAPSAEDRRVAAARLAAQQHDGGGWSWTVGGTPDVDTTGMVASALRTAPMPPMDAALDATATVAWLLPMATAQGFPAQPGGKANCDSTVWGLRALRSLGQDVPAGPWSYLRSLQDAGNDGDAKTGGFAFQAGQAPNAMCTAEVVALLGTAAAEGWLPRNASSKAAPGLPLPALPLVLACVALSGAATRRGASRCPR